MIHRQVNRAIYGAVAAVFAIALLVMVHIVAYDLLLGVLPPTLAAVVLLAVDLVVATVFSILATRSTPDALEVEARELRNRSLAGMRQSVAIDALAGPLGRLAWRAVRRRSRK